LKINCFGLNAFLKTICKVGQSVEKTINSPKSALRRKRSIASQTIQVKSKVPFDGSWYKKAFLCFFQLTKTKIKNRKSCKIDREIRKGKKIKRTSNTKEQSQESLNKILQQDAGRMTRNLARNTGSNSSSTRREV
jgi:predicted metal-dependent hydrolase